MRFGIRCAFRYNFIRVHNLIRNLLSKQIARFVLNIHMGHANDTEQNVAAEIDIDKMKRYIAYCKS